MRSRSCARASTSARSRSATPPRPPSALSQIGTGERSEKIRTYNFPERRVTDHRIKFTAHNLDAVLAGDLSAFTQALQDEDRRRSLEAASSALRPGRP